MKINVKTLMVFIKFIAEKCTNKTEGFNYWLIKTSHKLMCFLQRVKFV